MEHRIHNRELVTVATFNTQADAGRLQSWLEDENIAAEVFDERKLQRFWFAAMPKAGVHVQVPKEQFVVATALLHSQEASDHLSSAVRCPSCDSLRVQYPDLTRKNVLPMLIPQLLVLLHLSSHKYYCEDCHFTWSDAPKRRPRVRPAHWRFLKDLPSPVDAKSVNKRFSSRKLRTGKAGR